MATESFRRTGKIQPIIVNQNRGNVTYAISPLPADCENGMNMIVRSVPPNLVSCG